MKFRVTEIEFDFEDEFHYSSEWTQHHFDNVTADTLETIWDADDEDDLIEKITAATGWCIKSIDYRIIQTRTIRAEYTLDPQDLTDYDYQNLGC